MPDISQAKSNRDDETLTSILPANAEIRVMPIMASQKNWSG